MADTMDLKATNILLYERKQEGQLKDRRRRNNQFTKKKAAKIQYQLFRDEAAVVLNELQFRRWSNLRPNIPPFSAVPYLCTHDWPFL